MKGTHKTPRATVDTNLVIGALITPSGIGQKLLTAFSEDAFEWIISTAAFSEIENVLTRETIQGKYRISTAKIEEALTTIAEAAVFLETPPVASLPLHSRDPKDDFLLALSIAGECDYLITGDKDLLILAGRREIGALKIVTAIEFLRSLP